MFLNFTQKPQEEPVTVMKVELCDPGAASAECRPVIGRKNVSIIKIVNDVAKPKIEFPVSQVDFVQSKGSLSINVSRLGYRACDVQCDWATSKGQSGTIFIPEGEDQELDIQFIYKANLIIKF